MKSALILNAGHGLGARIEAALRGLDFTVSNVSADNAPAASIRNDGPVALLVVLPFPDEVSTGTQCDVFFNFLNALASQAAPPRERDDQGEWRAPAQCVLVSDANPMTSMEASFAAARTADLLYTSMRRAALEFAPKLRVNMICPPRAVDPRWADYTAEPGRQADGGDDLAAALNYLISAEPVTGELLAVDLADPTAE